MISLAGKGSDVQRRARADKHASNRHAQRVGIACANQLKCGDRISAPGDALLSLQKPYKSGTITRLAAELTQAAHCINISETNTNRCSSGGIRNQQVVGSIPTAGSIVSSSRYLPSAGLAHRVIGLALGDEAPETYRTRVIKPENWGSVSRTTGATCARSTGHQLAIRGSMAAHAASTRPRSRSTRATGSTSWKSNTSGCSAGTSTKGECSSPGTRAARAPRPTTPPTGSPLRPRCSSWRSVRQRFRQSQRPRVVFSTE